MEEFDNTLTKLRNLYSNAVSGSDNKKSDYKTSKKKIMNEDNEDEFKKNKKEKKVTKKTTKKTIKPKESENERKSRVVGLAMTFMRDITTRNQFKYTLYKLLNLKKDKIKTKEWKKIYRSLYSEYKKANDDLEKTKKYNDLFIDKPHYKKYLDDIKYGVNEYITDKMLSRNNLL